VAGTCYQQPRRFSGARSWNIVRKISASSSK
jgi:hypothetical protein